MEHGTVEWLPEGVEKFEYTKPKKRAVKSAKKSSKKKDKKTSPKKSSNNKK